MKNPGFELVTISSAVSPIEWEQFKDEPGFLHAIRGTACRALAEMISRDASIHSVRVPSATELQIDPFKPVIHTWELGVARNMDAVQARHDDMERARQEGRAEAANILAKAADRYSNGDGGCAHVIASVLRDAASEIRRS